MSKYKNKLVQIVPYKNDDDNWRLILYYERENLETGEVMSIKFDNVENPFPTDTIITNYSYGQFAKLDLRRSDVNIYGTSDENGKYVYYNQVVLKEGKKDKKPINEMTLEEIGKELGYSIKLVKR